MLWPASSQGFVFEDKKFLVRLMNTCKFKFGTGHIEVDYLKKTVAEHKMTTSFHLRPTLVKGECGRCQRTHKACSLCGQIFFGDDRTPKFSGDALNEFTGFLHVFDKVIDADLTKEATCKDLLAVHVKMCPSIEGNLAGFGH